MPDGHIQIPGSFRDPSGFVFLKDGRLLRQVNRVYRGHYDHLVSSGLYLELVRSELLIPHTEVGLPYAATDEAYAVIEPERIPFISYPYEWCFSQLKDAALLTLHIQAKALEYGMSLKDCSAYNVQFVRGKPIFIDTLSFELYQEGQPWVAYRQFCEHLLAPLALMGYVDVRLHHLLRAYIDGIPLDLASQLLPSRTWIDFGLLSHIHLHARAQQRFADRSAASTRRRFGRTAFLGLVENLRSTVNKLTWRASGTEWHEYYAITNYSEAAFEHKKQLVAELLAQTVPPPKRVWDLGANTGVFSRLASDRGILTISFDMDPAAVEQNYRQNSSQPHILPLVLDLTNPSSGTGWANRERMSLLDRGPADLGLALALIHHLAISNNLPFGKIARFLSQVCQTLIIEFVPKSDSQVQRLLSSREDIFGAYDQETFEREFCALFTIQQRKPIRDTSRTLYLMTAKGVLQASA
jgi:hypothetical protein